MSIEKDFNEESNIQTGPEISWLFRAHMPDVLRIENESFESPWTEEDFLYHLRQRNCSRKVIKHHDKIMGFMIYELHKSRLRILNFAVDPEFRRQGIGRQMVEYLINQCFKDQRKQISLDLRESNLGAQIFFQSQGFQASHVTRNHYEDTHEDAYLMQYRVSPNPLGKYHSKNRISAYLPSSPLDIQSKLKIRSFDSVERIFLDGFDEIAKRSFNPEYDDEWYLPHYMMKYTSWISAEYEDELIGAAMYKYESDSKIKLLKFIVSPDFQRKGVGTQIMEELLKKDRKEITFDIHEKNWKAQMFFRSHGFRAVKVLRNQYEATKEDAYVMRRRTHQARPELLDQWGSENRFSQYWNSDLYL